MVIYIYYIYNTAVLIIVLYYIMESTVDNYEERKNTIMYIYIYIYIYCLYITYYIMLIYIYIYIYNRVETR